MSIPPNDDWSRLGFAGNPLPGDPQVLQQVVDDFTYLRDMAWSVSQGLDAFLGSASSGGFEGATADALRGVISGRLNTFVFNIARAFSLAGEAVAEYRLALMEAQQAVGGVLSQAAGLTAGDPEPAGLKGQVADQVAQVRDAEALMIRALEDASAMVSQPIKMPSLFDRIWKGVELALEITVLVLGALAIFVGGPAGWAAFVAGAALVGMNAVDLARGRTNVAGFAMSLLGLLAPETRGLFSLEALAAGLRGSVGALGKAGGKAVDVLSSPAAFRAFVAQDGERAWQALVGVPGLVVDSAGRIWAGLGAGARAVRGLVAGIPRGLRSVGDVVGQDFVRVRKWYPVLTAAVGAHTTYGLVNGGRALGALFTPMTFHEMAVLGFRGAWRAVWGRASLVAAGRAVSAGWTGARAARAGVETLVMLHGLRDLRPGARAGVTAGPVLVLPGPVTVAWVERTASHLGEPPLAPVTTWRIHDLQRGEVAPRQGVLLLLAQSEQEETIPAVGRLGATGLTPGESPALVDALFPAASPIVRDKLAQDTASGWMNTNAGLLVPTEGVLRPEVGQVLRQLGSDGVDRLLAGRFDTVTGADGLTVHQNDTAALPHQEPHAEVGRLVQLTDVPRVQAPTAGFEARQALELLHAGAADPGEAPLLAHRIGPVAVAEAESRHAPLSLFEAMDGPDGPDTLQASLRYTDARAVLETGTGRTGEVPAAPVTQTELHTAAADSHARGIDPGTVDSRVQAMFMRIGVLRPQAITLPPVRTGVIREGLVKPDVMPRGTPQLDGTRVQQVHEEEPALRLELVDSRGVPLADGVATRHATSGGFQGAGGSEGVPHFPEHAFVSSRLNDIPEESFRQVPLSAPGLRGLHIQMIEGLTADGRFESVPLQLIDVSGAAVTGHQFLPRADGGLTITNATGDRRWSFGPERRLETLDVRLPRREEFVRFDHASDGRPLVVDPEGNPVTGGFTVEPVLNPSGSVSEVTVRVSGAAAGNSGPLAWRFDAAGAPRAVELPLTGKGIGAMSGLSMRLEYAADGTVTESSLIFGYGLKTLFEQDRVPRELADLLGAGGISVQDNTSREVVHFDTAGRAVFRNRHTETDLVRGDWTSSAVEEHIAVDPNETLKLFQAARVPIPPEPEADLEEATAGVYAPPTVPQPRIEPRRFPVRPDKVAAALARVFAGNIVADSGSAMLYQALSDQPVNLRADLRTGAFDALGTTVFAVGGSTLAKGAGFNGPIGKVLKADGALGTLVNGAVGNVIGGLVADWSNQQKPSGIWQDAITNAASGAVGNAGNHAIARALKERSRLNGETISNRDKAVNTAIRDPLGTLMNTAAYTAGDATETDVQNLTSGG